MKPVDKRLLFRYPVTEDDTEQKKNNTEDDELSYFNNSSRSDCCDQRDLMVGMFVFFLIVFYMFSCILFFKDVTSTICEYSCAI